MSKSKDVTAAPLHGVVMPCHRDRRFSRATYVVEYDHVIEYAGSSFMAARAVLRGSRNAVVWMDGKWMGYVNADGDWQFKTKHNPSA